MKTSFIVQPSNTPISAITWELLSYILNQNKEENENENNNHFYPSTTLTADLRVKKNYYNILIQMAEEMINGVYQKD